MRLAKTVTYALARNASMVCSILLFALLGFSSCHKHSINTVSSSNYPNKAGDQWVYYVQDSLTHVNDTLTVTVLTADTFEGLPSQLWQFAYSTGSVDTMQAQISGDTINYYTPSLHPVLNFALLFPFSAGSSWKDNTKANYSVTFTGNYNYLNDEFTDVYDISHTAIWLGGGSITDNIYITPGTGIVHRRISEFDMGPVIGQTWTLISYHLN